MRQRAPGRWAYAMSLACLWLVFAPRVWAIQPVVSQCPTLYPALHEARLETILHILDKEDSGFRSDCALKELPRFGQSAFLPLVAMLQSKHEAARANAATALGDFGEQALAVVPVLEALLDDPSKMVQWNVLNTLARIEPRSPVLTSDLLRRLDRDPHASNLIVVISRSGALPANALPMLMRALPYIYPYGTTDDAAIDAISHVRSPQAITALAGLIGYRTGDRGDVAASDVGRFGARALPALLWKFTLADNDAERRRARGALNLAWQATVTPELAEYFQTDMTLFLRQIRAPDAATRSRARQTLARLMPAFSPSLRMPYPIWPLVAVQRCNTIDALKASANLAADKAERAKVGEMIVAFRHNPPLPCPVPVY